MHLNRIKLHQSIAGHLLKTIIGGYLIVMTLVIVVQLVSEYYYVKNQVIEEVQRLEISFGPGINDAVWINNFEALHSILIGMKELSIVTGVKIDNESGKSIQSIGTVINRNGKVITLDQKGNPLPDQTDQNLFSNLLVHQFPIRIVDVNSKDYHLGTVTVYSSSDVIFSKIQHGVFLILISAALKTTMLCILVIFFVLRILGKPLGKLASDIEQVNLDNLEQISIHVETAKKNELKVLEKAFNAMIQKLLVSRTALHEYAKKYRNIFENAIEGIFQSDADNLLVNANPAMAKTLGYDSVDELIHAGGNIFEKCFSNPEDIEHFTKKLDEEGQVIGFEAASCRKDGSPFWGAISVRKVSGEAGEPLIFEGSLIDITERKQKEEADKKRKEAEASTKAKSDFLANMSHEIRTPMNAVIGLTHLTLQTDLTPKQLDYLKKIRGSSQALLGIINDILDFSKIEAGKLSLENIDFQFQDVLEHLRNIVTVNLEKKLEILFDVDRNIPDTLKGDSLRLGQILTNLLGNAIKFTEEGEVVLRAAIVKNEPSQLHIQFSVRDTGIGMHADNIKTLFQSFSQADSSVTRKYGGTGLGLPITKQLIEMMGGELKVESTLGKGSTFSFEITLEKGRSDSTPSSLLIPQDIQGKSVLIVDDNTTSQQILSFMLEGFSFKVTTAGSGPEALNIIEQRTGEGEEPFSLIFMDWKMPGMNGIETIKKIREQLDSTNMPAVLMVSAFGNEEVMNEAKMIGVNGFLVKPAGHSIMLDTIFEIFGYKPSSHYQTREKWRVQDADIVGITGSRILLVEDNAINQQIANEFLEQLGMKVDIAVNGMEGVKKACEEDFDLVLMDVQMPVMDGLDAARKIRDNGFTELPIVAMTAHAMVTDHERSLAAGMNDHLVKPVDPLKLKGMLIKWIPRKNNLGDIDYEPADKDGLPDDSEYKIPAFNSIDTKKGLALLGKNKPLYLSVLNNFYLDYHEVTPDYLEQLNSGDFSIFTHTIKGISENIGAMSLSEVAKKLDETQNKVLIPLLYQKLKPVITELKENIKTITPHSLEDGHNMPELLSEKRDELFASLKEALGTNRPKNCQPIVEEIKQYQLNTKDRELFEKVIFYIENFDFRKATETLRLSGGTE